MVMSIAGRLIGTKNGAFPFCGTARDMLTSCRRVALPIDTKNGSAESKPPRRTMCGGVQTEFLDSCSNNAWESLIKDVRGSSSHSRPPSDAPRACSHMTMLPV